MFFIFLLVMVMLDRILIHRQGRKKSLSCRMQNHTWTATNACTAITHRGRMRRSSLATARCYDGRKSCTVAHLCISPACTSWTMGIRRCSRRRVGPVMKQLLDDMRGQQFPVDGRIPDRVLLRLMPNLLHVCPEREPDSDQVGGRKDDTTKVHQRLDISLEKRVIRRVRLVLITSLARRSRRQRLRS